MSVLLEFAMFPTDKGESVSSEVSKVIENIRSSGYPYKLTAMGTIVETATVEQATALVNESYKILEPHSERVYSSLKMDIRKGKSERLAQKIKSVEEHIGTVNQ